MLDVRDVTVTFGDVAALSSVSLEVTEGETLALLGPSGCGKSTLLRVIAGLQRPDSGSVSLDGVDLASTPPHRRSMGLMFQDHALFGHLPVGANVAFGPRMQGMAGEEVTTRVSVSLALVGLAGFDDRDIATLSGGEAQRVALARSLAARPRLLMLDEPLGSLDRALRDRLVEEIPVLLRHVGLTSIHVTHDHDEAFAVADRVAVMRAGRIERLGAPVEVWRDPRSEFVARFLGHENIVEVDEQGRAPWGALGVASGAWVIRADAVSPAASGSVDAVEAVVAGRRYRGDRFELRVVTDAGRFELSVLWPDDVAVGARIAFDLDEACLARLR
jgi:thiamine transport system ATP-binding protein